MKRWLLFTATFILIGQGCDYNQATYEYPDRQQQRTAPAIVEGREAEPSSPTIVETNPAPPPTPTPTYIPAPEPTPTFIPEPEPYTPPSTYCCKICKKGKACGDSCISRSYTCHKGPGCACNGY